MPTSPRVRDSDACPGVLRTHRAADGALARLRLPGGRLTPQAARELAACARELADGQVALTSRGNVQLRGLADGGADVLAARVRAVGLLPSDTHERVRNIVSSPLSGRLGGGRDVGALVAELDAGLCAEPELAQLPGRFLFAVDDGTGDLAGLAADLTLRAGPAGRTLMLVAGESRALQVPGAAAVPALLAAARVFVDLRHAGGAAAAAWRVGELPAGRGRMLMAAAAAAGSGAEWTWAPTGPPLVGGTPAADEGGGPPGGSPGLSVQHDGRQAVTALVPLGRLRADQLDLLAQLAASAAGDGQLTVTPWRCVVLRDLAPAPTSATAAPAAWKATAGDVAVGAVTADVVARRLGEAGLVVAADSGWTGVTGCAGRPGCSKALSDVRRDAARSVHGCAEPSRPPHGSGVSSAGSGGRRRQLPVHWSGCARRCGQPGGAAVEVVAEPSGYRVRRAGAAALVSESDASVVVPWVPGAVGELAAVQWATLVGAVAAARMAGPAVKGR